MVVPYLYPDRDFFYIDIYDLDLNLISRYKMPNIIADVKKGEHILAGDVMIDNDNYLYALVESKEDYPKVVKYKLIFE